MKNTMTVPLEDDRSGYEREWLDGFLKEKPGHILDSDGIRAFREKFRSYEGRVVVQGTFDSDEWVSDDVRGTGKVCFCTDREAYQKGAGRWTGLSFEDFGAASRGYMAKLLGKLVRESLCRCSRSLIHSQANNALPCWIRGF